MSKMGISTYQSYCGAQIFDAVGLKSDFVAEYFTGTATRIEGVGLPRSPRKRCGAIATRSATRRSTATRSTSAANISSACAARITSGPPRPYRRCSTRCAATCPTSTGPTPRSRTSSPSGCSPSAACSASKSAEEDGRKPVAARRGRARRNIVRAVRDRRHVVRLDLARGPYHARDRHEPHRRQVQHRRRRRGGRPLQAAAERRSRCARRSSRWPRAASE